MFWNEIEILYIRLDILYNYVDHFIICESKKSHSGKVYKDEYNFIKYKDKFQKYLDKIIFLKIPDELFTKGDTSKNKSGNDWPNENLQRKYLYNEIKKFPDDTLVSISDVDEIWDPSKLNDIIKNVKEYKICGIEQYLFYYYLNCKKEQIWRGTYFILRKDCINSNILQKIRNIREQLPIYITDGGWHFSWIGNVDKIKEKFNCIAEHDLIENYSNKDNINKSLNEIKDLFNRTGYYGELKIIDIENKTYLPNNIKTYLNIFPSLFKEY